MKTSRSNLATLANMRFSGRQLVSCALALGLLLSPIADAVPTAERRPAAVSNNKKQSEVLKGLPIADLSEDEAIVHALNRLAYGPRPGVLRICRRCA